MTHSLPSDRLGALRAAQQHAFERAPAIREIYERARMTPQDIRSAADLARLPVTSKDALLERQRRAPPFGGFLTVDEAAIQRIFVSPGPIYEPQLVDDQDGHGFAHCFQRAGLGPQDRVLNTWSYHLVPAGVLLDQGIAATGATVVPCGPGGAEQQAQLILELGITCICASTAFFLTLIRTRENMGHALPCAWKLKSAFLGGEMGDWMGKRRALESRYGIKIFSAYATGDFGLIGYEEADEEGYTVQPERLVQICDPQTGVPLPLGETGEIVVTTMNRGWPLVRFGTGDVASGRAASADGFVSHINLLEGRVGQGVKAREIFIYPRNVEEVLAQVPPIQRAQVVVTSQQHRETITLRGVLNPGGEAAMAEKALHEIFKQRTRLKLDAIEWISADDLAVDAPLLVDRKHS